MKKEKKELPHFFYNFTVYTPPLKLFAKEMLKLLPPPLPDREATHLVTSSSSGCAIASAMIVLSRRPIDVLYIRKPNETSHSSGGTAVPFPENTEFIFVDDAIASGKTLRRCINFISGRPGILKGCKITKAIIITDYMICTPGREVIKGNKIQVKSVITETS